MLERGRRARRGEPGNKARAESGYTRPSTPSTRTRAEPQISLATALNHESQNAGPTTSAARGISSTKDYELTRSSTERARPADRAPRPRCARAASWSARTRPARVS